MCVYNHANWVISAGHGFKAKKFFEIESESFFKKLGTHFKEMFNRYAADKKKYGHASKFKQGDSFFRAFTIKQLDKFNTTMKGMSVDIQKKDKSFVSAYFSKVFSSELSEENQKLMTLQ